MHELISMAFQTGSNSKNRVKMEKQRTLFIFNLMLSDFVGLQPCHIQLTQLSPPPPTFSLCCPGAEVDWQLPNFFLLSSYVSRAALDDLWDRGSL